MHLLYGKGRIRHEWEVERRMLSTSLFLYALYVERTGLTKWIGKETDLVNKCYLAVGRKNEENWIDSNGHFGF